MNDKIINECVLYNMKLSFTASEAQEYEEVSNQLSKLIQILHNKNPNIRKEKLNLDQFITVLKKIIRIGDEELGGLALSILQKMHERQDILYNAKSRLLAVTNLIKLINKNKKIIIFTERITQVDSLYSILNDTYKGKISRYHSKMEEPEKQLALDSFRVGSTNILITCKALDEGLNIPSADIAIILSGNSQERQRIQRLGRILRKEVGKSQSSLFYCYLDDTVERKTLLEEKFKDNKEFNLVYDNNSGNINFPYYEKLSQILLNEIKIKNLDLVPLFSTYLNEGSYNNDWLESSVLIEEKIINAISIDRKNYWYCMKKIHQLKTNLLKY